MPQVTIDLTDNQPCDFIIESNGFEIWYSLSVGDTLINLNEETAEWILKNIAFQHPPSAKRLPRNLTPDQYWQWVCQAIDEKIKRDKRYIIPSKS